MYDPLDELKDLLDSGQKHDRVLMRQLGGLAAFISIALLAHLAGLI